MYRPSPFYKFLLLASFLAGALATTAVSAETLTLDEILERHLTARGGRDNWKAIHSITQSGTFSGFSKVGPFTLHRARDNKYYLDHLLNEHQVLIGYDGEMGWWVNPMQGGPWPQHVTGADLAVLMQKVDFESPFFDPLTKGYRIEFLGEGDFEGQPALRLRLVRVDGSEETWYLDPHTFLEMGFEATGSDFGSPSPQRTYFDDFRDVAGVKIPFYIEAQWYTRLRVLEVENIEINPQLDPQLFVMPIPEPMQQLASLAGPWQVAVTRQAYPGGPWDESTRQATIEPRLRGALLEERFVDEAGAEVVRQITWDRFQERYRISEIDDATALLKIWEGTFDDQGLLTVSNQETRTHVVARGNSILERNTYSDISPEGFQIKTEYSTDGGETWSLGPRLSYSRVPS